MKRPTLANVHKIIAQTWAERGTCSRARVGCVLVRDGHTIASAYNGSPSGAPHCVDDGCIIQVRDSRESCIRTLHAEQALISFCARKGIITEGTSLWITLSPCYDCAKLIINAGIKEVHYRDEYSGATGLDLLREEGVVAQRWEDDD